MRIMNAILPWATESSRAFIQNQSVERSSVCLQRKQITYIRYTIRLERKQKKTKNKQIFLANVSICDCKFYALERFKLKFVQSIEVKYFVERDNLQQMAIAIK